MRHTLSRRRLLGRSAITTLALATPLSLLLAARAQSGGSLGDSPYGPLREVEDRTTGLPLLRLPRGFSYTSFGWTGDVMSDGASTPGRHDGMAVVAGDLRGLSILVRNHELSIGELLGSANTPVYDDFSLPGLLPGLAGGTSTTWLGPGGYLGSYGSLAGTVANCAGGPTPWGSWLTCEEVIIRGGVLGAKDHGYVFEVPALAGASAQPIVGMGLMKHEAAAVDPATGAVYLTEDNGDVSGFYRYLPYDRRPRVGALEAGGDLQMLRVLAVDNVDLGAVAQGDSFTTGWVPIADPDADPDQLVPFVNDFPPIIGAGRSGPYRQGEALGGARFRRGEGCWAADGLIYFVDTTGGAARKGVVWAYDPSREHLTALYVSPAEAEADNLDNVTVSPRGGLLLCEDGGGHTPPGAAFRGTRLVGVSQQGMAFDFAENNLQLAAPLAGRSAIAVGDYRGSEFAGACFDRWGRTLYANIQSPGVSFAINGPWRRGPL